MTLPISTGGCRRKRQTEPYDETVRYQRNVHKIGKSTCSKLSPDERTGPAERRVASYRWILALAQNVDLITDLRRRDESGEGRGTTQPPRSRGVMDETRKAFENALGEHGIHQFNHGRALAPEDQGRLYEQGVPIREAVIAAFDAAIAAAIASRPRSVEITAPLKGREEIAEALFSAVALAMTCNEHDIMVVCKDAADAILSRGIAWDVEAAVREVKATLHLSDPQKVARRILAAAMKGEK